MKGYKPSPPACLILAEEAWGGPLQVLRSLGGMGVSVLVATAGSGASVYRKSRHCTAAVDIDADDPDRFCTLVAAWAEAQVAEEQAIVVLPLSDRLVHRLSLGRHSFGDRFRLSIPSEDVIAPLLSKHTSFPVAETAGLDVPPWTLVSGPQAVEESASLRLPVAVRPSNWSTYGKRYFKIDVFREAEPLREGLDRLVDQGATLVAQEYIEAEDTDVEFAVVWRSRDKSATAVCTGRKRRQAGPFGGVMVWGETAHLPEVHERALRFLDASGFTGLGGIEFIRREGKYWFIEFNPRLEAIHFMAAHAGVDMVQMMYRDLAFDEFPSDVPTPRIVAAWVGNAWLQRLFSDRQYRLDALRDWASFAITRDGVRAVWSWKDPLPGLTLFARLAKRIARSLADQGARKEIKQIAEAPHPLPRRPPRA